MTCRCVFVREGADVHVHVSMCVCEFAAGFCFCVCVRVSMGLYLYACVLAYVGSLPACLCLFPCPFVSLSVSAHVSMSPFELCAQDLAAFGLASLGGAYKVPRTGVPAWDPCSSRALPRSGCRYVEALPVLACGLEPYAPAGCLVLCVCQGQGRGSHARRSPCARALHTCNTVPRLGAREQVPCQMLG